MISENPAPTVGQALSGWLSDFEGFQIDEDIRTDQLDAQAAAYGLYKTPQATVVNYVDGTRDVTAYYRFLARQRTRQERSRQESQALLERFEQWVRKRGRDGELPWLGPGRTCQGVSVASPFSMEYREDSEAVYQLTLAVNYIEAGA